MKETVSFAMVNAMLTLLFLVAAVAQNEPSTSPAEEERAHNASKQSDTIRALPECSLAKTNKSCRLTIDRVHPVAPPTLQMYEGQFIVVVLENPKPFERYFLDYTSGQATLKPDVASNIVQAQGLLSSLQGLSQFKALEATVHGFDATKPGVVCASMEKIDATALTPGKVKEQVEEVAVSCINELADIDLDIYQKLEPLVAPDSSVPVGTVTRNKDCKLQDCIAAFLEPEYMFSAKITEISKFVSDPAKFKPAQKDIVSSGFLATMQKSADVVAVDLQGYKQRLAEIPAANPAVAACHDLIVSAKESKKRGPGPGGANCILIRSQQDSAGTHRQMVTRTITYSLDILNLVSNSQEAVPDPGKKKALATITLNFAGDPQRADSLRWEASAGAWFSSLPVRSFSVAPVFTGNTITDKKITQSLLYPTVVPFAAANYRLTNDLGWTRWKSNFYLTGAIGINPNTKTADFATGLSLSWRAIMLSGLCHFGHDVRLTQGLTVGESLGAGFNGSLSTQTYWRTRFAIGLSVRVPSLTGR